MFKKVKALWNELGKSIFVGDRLQNNLRVLTHVSIVTAALGMVLVIMDILRGEELVLLIAACMTFLGGVFCAYFAYVRRNRRIAAMIPTAFCIIAFTIYAVTGMGQGTAIYWTLMMPIGISYFVGVRADILLSAYYSVLFCIIFYVPSIRAHMAQYYSEAFMTRFPLLFIALAIFTLIAMVQYHRMARRDIEYADRLNAEVEKQTAVARERADKLALMSEEMVRMMAVSIDAKDRYTNGHSNRVAAYSAALADALGWTKEECYTLWKEALLHDIGKIGIPDIVLNKPGRLTDDEFRIIKSHTTIGGRILGNSSGLLDAADVAQCHHERWDGSGYPAGLAGDSIPAHARIVSIADAYDAMRSDRIYRKGLDPAHIREELIRGSGKQFDPVYLEAFVRLADSGALEELTHTVNKSLASSVEIGLFEAPSDYSSVKRNQFSL